MRVVGELGGEERGAEMRGAEMRIHIEREP